MAYIQALRHSSESESGFADAQIAAAQASLDLVNAQLAEMTKQRDFYKEAYDSIVGKKRGFWHTFLKIITLGIAR